MESASFCEKHFRLWKAFPFVKSASVCGKRFSLWEALSLVESVSEIFSNGRCLQINSVQVYKSVMSFYHVDIAF